MKLDPAIENLRQYTTSETNYVYFMQAFLAISSFHSIQTFSSCSEVTFVACWPACSEMGTHFAFQINKINKRTVAGAPLTHSATSAVILF